MAWTVFGKANSLSRTTIPIVSTPLSSNTTLAKSKIPLSFLFSIYPYSTESVQDWLYEDIVQYSRGIFVLDTIAYQILILPNSQVLIIQFMGSNEVL